MTHTHINFLEQKPFQETMHTLSMAMAFGQHAPGLKINELYYNKI